MEGWVLLTTGWASDTGRVEIYTHPGTSTRFRVVSSSKEAIVSREDMRQLWRKVDGEAVQQYRERTGSTSPRLTRGWHDCWTPYGVISLDVILDDGVPRAAIEVRFDGYEFCHFTP
jgi:hypothetical protein